MKRIAILFFFLIVSSSIFAYTEVSGNITGTVTWVAGTYYATSDLDVNSTATLTLNPGVIIKFAPGTQFKITGILYSNGTDLGANKIVFTSRDDNTHGETITESDGTPNAGDWDGFWFDGTQSSYPGKGEFDYSIIRYGGNSSGFGDANLYMNKGSGFFNNGICEYSATHGLRYKDTHITISSNTINNNANNGVMLESSAKTTTPNVFSNTFTSNGSYAANLQSGRVGNISGNSGSGNGINGLGISGAIISNQTWSGYSGSFPIILLGQVNVINTYILTIPASTIIKAEANGEIFVNGTIDVNGGSSSAVIFTSYKDDTYGGDTYGDGSATTPAPGDWKGIAVSNTGNYSNADGGKGYFDYCIIRYGGNSSTNYDANLSFSVSAHTGTVTGCVIEQSANSGIYSYDSYVKIRSSRIINNGTYGVYGKRSYYNGNVDLGNASTDEGNNRITGNGSYAIYNDGYNILAEKNYWGATTTGEIAAMINNVSGSVDYDPWLSSDPTVVPSPVELTSFTAALIRSKERNYSATIQLNWTTATEVNNYGFEIQRTHPLIPSREGKERSDRGVFETIGFVNGHGNSNSPKNYSFIDSDKLTGIVQYRLKQIDTDGSFEYSDIVEVSLDLPKQFKLSQNYPNPFNPSTTISYGLPNDSKVRVEIFNILGQRVDIITNQIESAGLHSTLWDAGHLASGIYIIRINATSVNGGDSFVKSIKMILMK